MTIRNAKRTKSPAKSIPANSRELTRFMERRHALKLGFELPHNTREAADYIGYHRKAVERMTRAGEIPADPGSGVYRKTRKVFALELTPGFAPTCGGNR